MLDLVIERLYALENECEEAQWSLVKLEAKKKYNGGSYKKQGDMLVEARKR